MEYRIPAGYNAYLASTGKANLAGWCRNADWVFPATLQDLAPYQRLLSLAVPNLPANIATAEPPGAGVAPTSANGKDNRNAEAAALSWPQPEIGASNGWAIGRDKSESGHGMVLANPHYPWVGSNRFWEKHLRIPGQLDIYGVTLIGVPGVGIGFNDKVAWTHTVSAGKRVTFYTLDLVPGKPTSYRYAGAAREMTSRKSPSQSSSPTGPKEWL
jgi:acyl-homoserine-lactone acylase